MPLPLMLIPMAVQGISALMSNNQAKKAEKEQLVREKELNKLRANRQEIVNPYENMANPFANLSVATQAAALQGEQTDIALANTLDTLRVSGMGAGGATALAREAAKSKKGIAANIELQETANQKAAAEGQFRTEQAMNEGEMWRFGQQEARDTGELDRAQGMLDNARAQEMQSKADMAGALGSMGSSLMGAVAGGGTGGTSVSGTPMGTVEELRAKGLDDDAINILQNLPKTWPQ